MRSFGVCLHFFVFFKSRDHYQLFWILAGRSFLFCVLALIKNLALVTKIFFGINVAKKLIFNFMLIKLLELSSRGKEDTCMKTKAYWIEKAIPGNLLSF